MVDDEELAGWIIPVAAVGGLLVLILCIAFIVFAYKKGQQSAMSQGGTVEMVTARQEATPPPAAKGRKTLAEAREYSAYGVGCIEASISSGGDDYGVLPGSESDGPRAYGVLPSTASDDGYGPLRT